MEITLEPYRPEYLEYITGLYRRPELQGKLFVAPAIPADQVQGWIERRYHDPDVGFLVVIDEGRPVGFAEVYNIEPTSRTGEIAICIDPAFQGNGVGTEALQLLHQYCRDVLKLKTISLSVGSSNHVALNMYHKAGYQKFAVMMEKVL